jgi:hypothetical protein
MQSKTSWTSSSNRDDKTSVRILILSANLGNAQPDDPSLNAWIPHDGYCKFAIQDPPLYPVVMDPSLASDDVLFQPNEGHPSEGLSTALVEAPAAATPINKAEKLEQEQANVATVAHFATEMEDSFVADFPPIVVASDDSKTSEDQIETPEVTEKKDQAANDDSKSNEDQIETSAETETEDSIIADFPPKPADFDNDKISDDHIDSVDDSSMAEKSEVPLVSAEEPADFLYTSSSDSEADVEDSTDQRQQSEEDEYEAFLAAQAVHDNEANGADDEYEAFLAAQVACVNQDEEANGGNDEYTEFLDAQKKKTLWGFIEAQSTDDDTSLSDEGSSDVASSVAPPPDLNLDENNSEPGDSDVNSAVETHSSDHCENDSVKGSFYVATSLPPPPEYDLAEAFPSWEPSPSNFRTKTPTPPVVEEHSCEIGEVPPPPADAEPFPEQEVEVPPADDEVSLLADPSPTKPQKEQFDIIVIGMQEATFETAEGGNDDFHTDDDFADDESLFSSSSEEEEVEESMGTSTTASSLSTEAGISLADKKKSKSLTGKVIGATLKAGKLASKSTLKAGKGAGKKTMKVGMGAGKATMKVGKATVKAGKAAKTLTKEKDHTKASTPTAQQSSTPLEDGGLSEWTDTKILHYLFEDQLPSYTRALSYQLGEMRLMIYYLKPEVNLDVLSVKAQATGMAGLANKGGIVAEVAVNESTRLGFLTAHLEAHVSMNMHEYFKRYLDFLTSNIVFNRKGKRSMQNGAHHSVKSFAGHDRR